MQALTVEVLSVAFDRVNSGWLPGLQPYAYQAQVYGRVREALDRCQTLCLFITTPTGSGKTLASYAYTIRHQTPAFGVYPTNELIRDQERALKRWIDPNQEYHLLRVDSAQLDDWQSKLDLQRHSETLEHLLNWEPTILTNPDILFYIFFGLYGGPEGVGRRLFSLIGQYRIFVFDEFHLYNVKQMADVAFLVGTLHSINPAYGRVFIFASATPESPAMPWLRDRLHLPVEVIAGEPSDAPEARTIAYPVRLTILPADLQRWEGTKALSEYLPQIQEFLRTYPQARLVTILDAVAGAIETAQALRGLFPGRPVGEVHGFSSDQERAEALRQPFTVGTSTIEVGIDFQDETEKDLLIFEARTAGQFIQRFGRLARHAKSHPDIPNWAIALVPEYVYHFMAGRLTAPSISRQALYDLVEEAYQKPEDFGRYLHVHAAAEFQEAVTKALTMFQPDDRPRVQKGLAETVRALTGKSPGEAWALYRRYRDEERILAPLLTFRGSGFEAAVLDRRGTDPGFPAKRYNLLFLLRRGILEELDEEEYLAQLKMLSDRWPDEVAREQRYSGRIGRGPDELLGVYGYFTLTGLLDRGRKVWFEVSQEQVAGRQAQVTVIEGLEVATEPEIRLRRLNRHLRRKQIVAWFTDRHPASIQLGRALPPLFEVHELRVRRPGGGLSDTPWSIVFNQDAFFVDSLGWWKERRTRDAIIL
jgi:CRISPR-associated endonuclease/helicase Cas3